ncbi:MAG: DUF763 domain-containing protein [Chloroflexi bacterium]|nr:DUF763 domain-containing protein [Chloroflexota bacterium]
MTTPPGGQRTGLAHLPLHGGKAPPWLFQRMVKLARGMTLAIVEDYGPDEVLRRLSDPFWFQAFGCVLGFDWHSSGVTTTVCGALKEGLRGLEHESGLWVAGGKGGTSRKTPGEVTEAGQRTGLDPAPLVYASRMAAKVDSAALQDGYQLYHHSFFFTVKGQWAVVQQGMNAQDRYARRYHWLGQRVESFVREPHAAIAAQARGQYVLNLVAAEAEPARQAIPAVAQERPEVLVAELKRLKMLELPVHHHIELADLDPDRLYKALLVTYERQPSNFEGLLALPGVGPRTVRALSLVAELVHGVPVGHREPALYAFAHGGKDGYPFPVDRATYDQTVHILSEAVRRARLGQREELDALRRLASFGRAG